jgi:hypothetical protein
MPNLAQSMRLYQDRNIVLNGLVATQWPRAKDYNWRITHSYIYPWSFKVICSFQLNTSPSPLR